MIYGLLITYQCIIQDYPVEACVRSLLDASDVVFVNDGRSTDGTLDVLLSIQNEVSKDRLVIIERDWKHDRHFWTDERNFILDNFINDGWVLSLDADEVLHEDEISKLKEAIQVSKYKSISFGVKHFYGRPGLIINGPQWFKRHTQLWHTETGIRWVHRPGGCADDILWPNGAPAHILQYDTVDAYLYHYGHCRSPKAMGMKVKRADDLYQNSEDYKNGSLADLQSWKYDINRPGIIPFTGSHPKYVMPWVDEHQYQELEFYV